MSQTRIYKFKKNMNYIGLYQTSIHTRFLRFCFEFINSYTFTFALQQTNKWNCTIKDYCCIHFYTWDKTTKYAFLHLSLLGKELNYFIGNGKTWFYAENQAAIKNITNDLPF